MDMLRGLSEQDRKRSLVDPQLGEMSLLDACRLITAHEMGHLGQLRNLVAVMPEAQDLGPVSRPVPAPPP